MSKTRNLDFSSPGLQQLDWPPVNQFDRFPPHLDRFLNLPAPEQRKELEGLRHDREAHARFVHTSLGVIYSYCYGYSDSPCPLGTDDPLEAKMWSAKLALEADLRAWWLPASPSVSVADQVAAAEYLRVLASDNPAVDHPLYRWLASDAPREKILTFLDNEVIRNEVVDDEVALLVRGQQGQIKNMIGVNLSDELGRGRLEHAHTFWLRLLLEHTEGWERIRRYRRSGRPWYAGITSNVFNMTLTRPGLKFAAFGHFLLTESWVKPHFERLLEGMARAGLCGRGGEIYFTAHAKLDPYHAEELLAGFANQIPALAPAEVKQVVLGAEWAVAGAKEQYDRMFDHLRLTCEWP